MSHDRWTISEGITPPSSLLQAHAPDQHPPSASGRPLCARSLQVAASPCWLLDLPDIISAIFVKVLGPLPRRVRQLHLPISSPATAASRHRKRVRHTRLSLQSDFHRVATFRGCSHSFVFGLLHSLDPQIAPTAVIRPGSWAVYATHSLGNCLTQDVVSLRA